MRLLEPALLQALRDPLGSFVHLLTGALLHFVDGARSDIEGALQRYLFSTTDTSVAGRPFTANPSLAHLNHDLALATDALVGAVLVFACLRSMWERSLRARYSLKVMLPRLMLAIVLAHVSLTLTQMGIDLDNALSHVALGLGSEADASALPWSASISHPVLERASIGEDLFHAVFAVVLVVAVVILVLAYVLRYALLAVLVVVAPLAGLCTALPETRSYARSWFRLFAVTTLMQPIQLIVLRVAEVLAFDPQGGLVRTLYALATLYLMLKVPGALNTAAHLETKAETLAHRLERSMRRAIHPTHRPTRASHPVHGT